MGCTRSTTISLQGRNHRKPRLMASATVTATALLLFFFSLFFNASHADILPSIPVEPRTACGSTPDPDFCRSVFPPRGSRNLFDYGRFSLARSLSHAQDFLDTVDGYLADGQALSLTAARALEDCRLLSSLNIDFLSAAGATLNSSDSLPEPLADEVQTLLSALLTDQQTCLEGLQSTVSARAVGKALADRLFNGTKLYGVSLALFARAWVPHGRRIKPGHGFTPSRVPRRNKPPGRRLLFHEIEIGRDGGLPLRMQQGGNRESLLLERRTGRKLLEAGSDAVLVIDIVVVSPDGSGNFTTVGDAVAAAPDNIDGSRGYFLIYIDTGVYRDNVVIPRHKKYLMMIGNGINQTVVTGNRSVADGWTTFSSATLGVVGQGFVAIDITFRNTAGAVSGQAVAVRNGADLSTFYSCSIEGYQDTLYTHSMRQFYRECDIYGTVDFIFGNAAVVFQSCNISARLPLLGQSNVVTAQGRSDPNQNTGISIHGCKFLASPELALGGGSTATYLGRPWRQYSRTVIMQSFMDSLIDPSGWTPWNGDFAFSTLYYAEHMNTGPGSDTSHRVKWPGFHVINSTDALNFTISNFVSGDSWLPQTGVPYLGGLQ